MPIEPVHSPPTLRSQLEVVRTGSNTRWGAIAAGVFVTGSSWLVLHVFGMGIGLTAFSSADSSELRSLGLGVGGWSMLAPILALFAGGLVASRLAPTPNRFNRMLHGVLVWAVTVLTAAVAIGAITTALVREVDEPGAGELGETTARGLGLDAGDLVAPINGRLRAEGKPAITASQLERAIDDAIEASSRTGRLDRETLVTVLADHAALTAGDADDIATEVEARWYRAAQRAEQLASRARKAAAATAHATGKGLLGLSLALMLGLTAAVGGALATGHRDRRRVS